MEYKIVPYPLPKINCLIANSPTYVMSQSKYCLDKSFYPQHTIKIIILSNKKTIVVGNGVLSVLSFKRLSSPPAIDYWK